MVYKVLGDSLQIIKQKKMLLDKHRPFPESITNNLMGWFKVELAYSSNAIEGNTLSRLETAVVIEKGMTIGGKLLREHLEATNHGQAFDFILSLVGRREIAEADILEIHRIVLSSIDTEYAGRYRDTRVRIAGSDVVFPNHVKIPELMGKFVEDINAELGPIQKALNAHYELVTIHPFVDGNGRTARLLMNLILMQHGYPPAIIKPRYRLKYLKALEQAQLGGSKDQYTEFMLKSIDKSMDIYINSVENKELPVSTPRRNLLRIGELAMGAKETIATIRHWIKIGLLEVSDTSESGYQLFDKREIEKCARIRELQRERLTLQEIVDKVVISSMSDMDQEHLNE